MTPLPVPTCRRAGRHTALCLELLEDRTVPTGFATQSGPTLTVTGTQGRDVIHLVDRGGGTVAVQVGQNPILQIFNGINTVNVSTFAGADTVTYDLVPLFGGPFVLGLGVNDNLTLNVDLGAGNDTFQASFHQNDLGFGSQLTFNVRGREGNDQMNVDATGGVDIANQAKLAINLIGDQGNDSINTAYEGVVSGELDLNGNGSAGRDRITERFSVPTNSLGKLVARARGGPGSDGLRLEVGQPFVLGSLTPPPLRLDALIDGGPGRDRGVATPNVAIINCEITQIVAPTLGTVTPTQL
jgi:hypothetical protein